MMLVTEVAASGGTVNTDLDLGIVSKNTDRMSSDDDLYTPTLITEAMLSTAGTIQMLSCSGGYRMRCDATLQLDIKTGYHADTTGWTLGLYIWKRV